MAITTVGELIDALKEFDPALPVLKSDQCAVNYDTILLVKNVIFPIKRTRYKSGLVEYTDPLDGSKDFDAVVL